MTPAILNRPDSTIDEGAEASRHLRGGVSSCGAARSTAGCGAARLLLGLDMRHRLG
jgi:hypothetical protein